MARLAVARPSQCWARSQPGQRRCPSRYPSETYNPRKISRTLPFQSQPLHACNAPSYISVSVTCRQDSSLGCSSTCLTASSSWRALRWAFISHHALKITTDFYTSISCGFWMEEINKLTEHILLSSVCAKGRTCGHIYMQLVFRRTLPLARTSMIIIRKPTEERV